MSTEDAGVMPDGGAPGPKFALASAVQMPGQSAHSAEDFRKLKVIMCMLEQRIAQEMPKARMPSTARATAAC